MNGRRGPFGTPGVVAPRIAGRATRYRCRRRDNDPGETRAHDADSDAVLTDPGCMIATVTLVSGCTLLEQSQRVV